MVSIILAFAFGVALGVLIYKFLIDKKHAGEADLKAALAGKESEIATFREISAKNEARLNAELEAKTQKIIELSNLSTAAQEQLKTIESLKDEFEKERENAFKNIVQEVIEIKAKSFDEHAKKSFNPLELDIKNFREKVEKLEEANKIGQQLLKQEIENIAKTSGTLQEKAENLTAALKGDPGTKGVWGEVTLANILERAGLKNGTDYFEQFVEGGHRFDILLKLPQDKWMIIDSKTTFENYMNYISAKEDDAKDFYLKAHVNDIKKTIDGLGKKEYHEDIKNAFGANVRPDFVLMFVNPQSALDIALKEDPTLLSYAWSRSIILVSADTLINTIEIVKRMWRIELQHQRLEDVISLIKKLGQRFTHFLSQMAAAEVKAKECTDAILVARGHIDGDNGSILPVVNQIVSTYHAPEISKANQQLLEKTNYDYTGKGVDKAVSTAAIGKDTELF